MLHHDNIIFPHKCEEPDCDFTVEFDDEPRCFKHFPDSGSDVRGYSARATQIYASNRKAQ